MANPRWRRLWPVCALAVLLVLGLLFVPECDDCYFVFWRFASWRDWLLTRPVTQGARVVGVPANGRYLGNFLGVLQAKLYFSPLGPLRGLLLGGALAALVWLLGERFAPANRYEGLLPAFALVVLAPRGIWQQVYSWGAGLANYLLPMVGVLLLARLLERPAPSRLGRTGRFLLGLGCCLFMEPVTLWLALAGTALAVYALARRRPGRRDCLAAALGVWLGALVMFTAPGYGRVGEDTRTLGLALLGENLHIVVIETLVRPAALALVISGLFLFLLKRQGCPRLGLWAVLLGGVHLLCLADAAVDLFQVWGLYTRGRLALGCALAALWLIALWEWRSPARGRVALLALCLCAVNAPLLVVSPIGPRNAFPGYVLLLLTAAALYRQAREQGLRPLNWLCRAAALAGVLLICLYGCNCLVYHQRLAYARQQAALGAREITLPLLPFPGWTANEFPGKGDLSYLVYRETPWDVAFQMVPFDQWQGK